MSKIGFINTKGEIAIAPRDLNSVRAFQNGVAAVIVGGKFGWIDDKGAELIPTNYKVIAASQGYFHVEEERFKAGVVKDGKFILPCTNNSVDVRGVADGMITVYDDNRRIGFYNLEGEKVIDHKYFASEDREGNDFTFFSEGLAAVSLEEYGPVGFINKAGEMVIEPQFPARQVRPFSEGLAFVGNGQYIDQTGKVVVQLGPDYTEAGDFHNGLALAKKANKARSQFKAGVINLKGKEVIKCSYNEVEMIGGVYVAGKGTSFRNMVKHLYSAEGKRVGDDYKTVLDADRGIAIVMDLEGQKLFVDTNTGNIYGGELGIKSINRLREGLVFAVTPDFTGFLNLHGEKAIDLGNIPGLTASMVDTFANGLCGIISPEFVGFIDTAGNKVIDLTADPVAGKATKLGIFSDGFCSFTV